MHELTRMAYLQALGVDAYVSRAQLPGAAATHRLALVKRDSPAEAPAARAAPTDLFPTEKPPAPRSTPVPAARRTSGEPALRFSIAAFVARGVLWLEYLGDMPLASEQVALVGAMAHALEFGRGATGNLERPEVAQFTWPMHNNPQLDNGEEAARASLGAFVSRRLEEAGCGGLVLLGADCERWLSTDDLDIPVVRTVTTLAMLTDPSLKPGAWRALGALRRTF